MLNKFEIKYVKLIFSATDPKDQVRYYHVSVRRLLSITFPILS